MHTASSDYYHESAMLDTYRLALDDTSDEDDYGDVSVVSSTADLFRAQSAVVKDDRNTDIINEDENEKDTPEIESIEL